MGKFDLIQLQPMAGASLDFDSSIVRSIDATTETLLTFAVIVLAGLLWYPLGPGYLFQALSVVAWITWIKPQNVIVNQIFGGFHGYSIGAPFTIFTLDWTMIVGFLGSPLVVPWMAIANTSEFTLHNTSLEIPC